MEKDEHGLRLRQAMAVAGMERAQVGLATGKGIRTITNWTTGKTMPDEIDRAALRKLFPNYDLPGDAVEVAVKNSELTEDRQYVVLGTYKRLLREQSEGSRSIG